MNPLLHQRQHNRLLKPIPGKPDEYVLELDYSTLNNSSCLRRFEYYALWGKDSPSKDALTYGKHIHTALEHLHRGGDPDLIEEILTLAWVDQPTSTLDWRTCEHAIEAIEGYRSCYKGQHRYGLVPFSVNDVEQVEERFSLPLFSVVTNQILPYPPALLVEGSDNEASPGTYVHTIHVHWTGKMDLVTIDNNGVKWIADHKTTSMEGTGFWTEFDLSAQMVGYTWAAKQLTGEHIQGAIINAIVGRKPTRTGVAHEYKRNYYIYSEEQIAEWLRDTVERVHVTIDSLCHGFFARTTSQCVGKYSICPYHKVCVLPEKTRPIMLASDLFTERTWSPLKDEKGPVKTPDDHKPSETFMSDGDFAIV